ncbi:hypothetical protein V6N13_052857 [Hibiscus sabdariffa]
MNVAEITKLGLHSLRQWHRTGISKAHVQPSEMAFTRGLIGFLTTLLARQVHKPQIPSVRGSMLQLLVRLVEILATLETGDDSFSLIR